MTLYYLIKILFRCDQANDNFLEYLKKRSCFSCEYNRYIKNKDFRDLIKKILEDKNLDCISKEKLKDVLYLCDSLNNKNSIIIDAVAKDILESIYEDVLNILKQEYNTSLERNKVLESSSSKEELVYIKNILKMLENSNEKV